ncbi:MAG TPA: hypothetical protein VFY45_27910 [Baekduia sp.]|nr:hypothetical protein [Baekduia sp.]
MSGVSFTAQSVRHLVVLLLVGAGAVLGVAGRIAVGVSAASAPAVPGAQQPDAIRVVGPGAGAKLAAQRLDHRRLTALVDLSGTAQPGAQLALSGGCGAVDCDALTYSDAAGRWHTRIQLTTPRGHRDVRLRVSYWPLPAAARAPVAARVVLSASAGLAGPAPWTPLVPQGAASNGSSSGARSTLVMIGDSLAIGTAQPLSLQLPDWQVRFDARVGRPLAEGMAILAATGVPTEPRTVLAFSLYTNDVPRDPQQLEAAVRSSVTRLGPHGCAIWATISRRAVAGVSYKAANERLTRLAADPQLAGRLLVVPWAEQVARHHGWKAHDHVHPTAAGNLARAQLYAAAARACAA